jgi:hypothetical protein
MDPSVINPIRAVNQSGTIDKPITVLYKQHADAPDTELRALRFDP